MDRKTKKEQKKKQKWGKSVSSSPDVVVSAAAPAEGVQAPSSSSRKRTFPSLRRVFRKMLCFLSCVSSCEVDESIEARSTSVDTRDDASSSPAVSRASDPEVELQAKTQEKEAIKGEKMSESHPSFPVCTIEKNIYISISSHRCSWRAKLCFQH